MSANIPIMQMLGSAAGIGGPASPAAAPAPVGQSAFSGIMGGLIAASVGQGTATGAMGSASSTNSSSGNSLEQSTLVALQSGQVTPEMIAALNSQQDGGSLAALAAKLAGLMSGQGQGRMVPLAAGFELSQLEAAGIELPESLTVGAGDGKAMLLVSEEGLKSLTAGGGWKDGESVPALLMLGSDSESGQPLAGYLDVSLSMVATNVEDGSSPSFGFQLNLDPASTINMISDTATALTQVAPGQVDGSPVLELAGLLARLEALAASTQSVSNVEAEEGTESVSDDNTQTITDSIIPSVTAGSAVAAQEASAIIVDAVSGTDAKPAIQSGQVALPAIEKLTAEIETLVNALAAGINGDKSGASGDAAGSSTSVLRLLAGDAAISAENGDTRAAGQALELIGKLGELSKLPESEKQQVLADPAGRLRSLLASSGTGNELATGTGSGNDGFSLNVAQFADSAVEAAPSMQATSSPASNTEAAAGQLLSSAVPADNAASQIVDPNAQNQVQPGNDTVAAPAVADSQASGQAPAGVTAMLVAIESAAATAGELADKVAAAATGSGNSTTIRPMVQGAQVSDAGPAAQNATETASVRQPVTTKAVAAPMAELKVESTAAPVSAQVVAGQGPEAASAVAAEGKTVGRAEIAREPAGRAGSVPVQEAVKEDARAERTVSLAASAKAGSDSRQVSVPVSLSSLSKSRRSQSKTQAINAVNAFTGNSQSAAKVAGESNDFMQALRAAAGEKGAADLIEATLVEKKSGAEELLFRAENSEQPAKPGGSQPQAGLRLEAIGTRQAASSGEQQTRQTPQVQTVNRDEAFEKIISSARLTRVGATSELTMKLDPDHLGMMRVKMSVDENNVMHARIQVETHEARSLIENNLHRLRDSLAEQGIKVEKFNVDVRQDQQGNQQQHAGAGNGGEYDQTGRGLSGNANGNGAGGTAENDGQAEDADQDIAPVNKYEYSTLEWVA